MNVFGRVWTTATLAFLLSTSSAVGQTLPTVAVLSTGGTISGRHDPVKGGYVPALSADDLVAAMPVVLVGAQRPASDPDSDGPRNRWMPFASRSRLKPPGKGSSWS